MLMQRKVSVALPCKPPTQMRSFYHGNKTKPTCVHMNSVILEYMPVRKPLRTLQENSPFSLVSRNFYAMQSNLH